MPELAKKVIARLRRERGETEPEDPALSIEEVTILPLGVFAARALTLRVWSELLDGEVWFVSSDAQVPALLVRGVSRGDVWTAQELADLLEVFTRDQEKARTVIEAKRLFGGTMRRDE